jgi:hypothetical protein
MMKSRRLLLMLVPFSIVAIIFLFGVALRFSILPAPQASSQISASPTRDPVLRLPGMADFISKYPNDWETRLDSTITPMVEFQRMIGEHATVVSFADNQVGLSNPNPKVRVFITDWDGTDLFAQGVVKTYRGKPVEIVPVEGQTRPSTSFAPPWGV